MDISYKVNGLELDKIFILYRNNDTSQYIAKIKNKDDRIKLNHVKCIHDDLDGSWLKVSWHKKYYDYLEFESEEEALYYTLKYSLTFN